MADGQGTDLEEMLAAVEQRPRRNSKSAVIEPEPVTPPATDVATEPVTPPVGQRGWARNADGVWYEAYLRQTRRYQQGAGWVVETFWAYWGTSDRLGFEPVAWSEDAYTQGARIGAVS